MKTLRKTTCIALLAAALAGNLQSAVAGPVEVYGAGDLIDPAAVARILSGDAVVRPAGVRTRSIRLLDDPAPAAAQGASSGALSDAPIRVQPGAGRQYLATPGSRAERPIRYARPAEPTVIAVSGTASDVPAMDPRPAERVPTALSLPVPFAFDSATLLPDARIQLDAVAEGIKMMPEGRRVVIEGHTDAIGADAYNQGLSERRARAVRDYLVAAHGIPGSRLDVIGLGRLEPLENTSPSAAVNRRVQFRGA